MRTEPGKYVLRKRVEELSTLLGAFEEFPAPRRADQLKQFNVLCLKHRRPANDWRLMGEESSFGFLKANDVEYKKLADVWRNDQFSFARLFVVIVRDKKLASFGGSRNSSGDNKHTHMKSIGLFGYVKEEDANLFSADEFGFSDAVRRTVIEQFHMVLSPSKLERLTTVTVRGVLSSSAINDENSFVVVASLECPREFDILRQIRSMTETEWLFASDRRNDLDEFEALSRCIITNGFFKPLDQNEEDGANCQKDAQGRRAHYSSVALESK